MLTLGFKNNYAVKFVAVLAHFLAVNALAKIETDYKLWVSIAGIIMLVSWALEKKHVIVGIGACNLAANLLLQLYTSEFELD